jgi:histidine ammonia-lyase
VLDALAALLNHDVMPCIPEEGSVGASGDLTPLSYVAAVLAGEGLASYDGQQLKGSDALARAGLEPVSLERPSHS